MKKAVAKKSRRLIGTVVSDKMDKTVVVSVLRVRIASKYGKQFNFEKKFKAHDEASAYHVGDKVVIEETRPLSKEKNWRVVEKISSCSTEAMGAKAPAGKIFSDEANSVKRDS